MLENIAFNLKNAVHKDFMPVNKPQYAMKNQIADARSLVDKLDFIDQNSKLISYHGWKTEKVMAIEELYRKWLVLHKVYGDTVTIAPNEAVDEYWHFHILDTRKYISDCNLVFGYYLHHYPYFGLTETETQEDLNKGFTLTQKLFQKHFGHNLTGVVNPCRSTSCR